MREPVLQFDRCPSVRPKQQDANGRLWQITKIEMPWCWAAPVGYDDGFIRYRLEVAQRRGSRRRRRTPR